MVDLHWPEELITGTFASRRTVLDDHAEFLTRRGSEDQRRNRAKLLRSEIASLTLAVEVMEHW
jgi:hypothetical protein